jgi:pteridine reductase
MQLWEVLLFVSVVFMASIAGLVFVRMWRRHAAKSEPPRRPTVYSDVWQESARRMPLESDAAREVVPIGDPPSVSVTGTQAGPSDETKAGVELTRDHDRPVVMITGGARRVGRAIAETFARAGCDVLITFRNSEKEADEAIASLRRHGVSAGAFRVDLGELDHLNRWTARLTEHLPRLDYLIHNASIYDRSPGDESIVAEAMRHYRINALAPLLLSARLAPLLARSTVRGGGAVIAMADIHAMGRPRRDFAAYSMSKAALAEMVHSLARDLAPEIRVNGVAPGVVAWPEEGADSDPSEQRGYLRRVPLGRAGTPEEAADVVRWLAMDATYLTGEIVRVDGGRWLT